jgi:putative transposase
MVQRSLRISLEFGNTGKKGQLDELWQAYKKALEDFLDRLFEGKDLCEEFLKSYDSPLSYRYKQCAKRQAIKIFKCWCRKKGKKGNKPVLKNVSMVLDCRFIEIENSENSFDFWIKISTLDKGNPVLIPSKSYRYLNAYRKNWNLLKGGRLVLKNGEWFLILTFAKEIPQRKEGKTISIDMGYRKLGMTNEKEKIGPFLRDLIEKADRKKPYSKAYYRVKTEIKHYVQRELKKVIGNNLAHLVLEDLKNLKSGKHGVWSKGVNRKFGFWIYGYAVLRLVELCEVAGVQCHKVVAAYTSQRCPARGCGHIEKGNRREEEFRCKKCGFAEDADYVGSLNIFARFTGEWGSWQRADLC